MVSGKPPRHSKSSTEPVTIDLDAKDVKEIGKEKDAAAADVKGKSEPEHTSEPEKAAATAPIAPSDTSKDSPKPVWDQPVKKPIEPEPNIQKTEELKAESSKAQESPKASSVPPTKAESIKVNEPKLSAPKVETTASAQAKSASSATSSPKSTADNRSGNSGLLAAGIVGGLIALLAAGSMQYAGYLPPFAGTSTSSDELTAMKTQIANLRAQIDQAPQAAGDTSQLESRLAALENASTGGDLAGKIEALETTVATLQSEKAAQDTANSDLTRRLSEAEAKLNEPRDDIEVARAIASAGLKAAIDRGGPFLAELDTLSRVTPDDPAIQSLRPFANTGVPSRSELTRNFPDVANAMLDSLDQADPNQGIFARLTDSALSLVKVRPVGNIEGEGAEAKIARMEDKLRNGDLKGAALEWDGVPDAAKAVSGDYKKSLDARIQVEDLVNATLTRAINSTGQQG
ncbi:hypothetical protein [Agrobacterium sp. fls2-241-TYG-188a]|uniref:COG4223 family protein n=1 Tax=Agrobacterium sp. fls2-241-TYG-188a TaxID=3040275 RepID=UPI00254F92F7|nr:hypothetical protein [Agrobacterium sp. fls2-241-TYG-188a]